MVIRERPLLTEECHEAKSFAPASESAYIFRKSIEQRSLHPVELSNRTRDVKFVEVVDEEPFKVVISSEGARSEYMLRSRSSLASLWQLIDRKVLYLDITGLRHHVWAPLLRSAMDSGLTVRVVYVEPSKYRPSLAPTDGEIYDLSEKVTGISPLPGFASLVDTSDQFCFVPLLGFEGTRVAYLIEQVQPAGGTIIPIIGVPGFRPEYPFITYLGNKSALVESMAWRKTRYAIANCPFALYYALDDIAADHAGQLLKVAPIGTKPHALGAIMYAIARPESVEIVYDHPIRKAERTEGASRLFVYHVSSFIH